MPDGALGAHACHCSFLSSPTHFLQGFGKKLLLNYMPAYKPMLSRDLRSTSGLLMTQPFALQWASRSCAVQRLPIVTALLMLLSCTCRDLSTGGKGLLLQHRAFIALQAARGLDYLHQSNIVHLDVRVCLKQVLGPLLIYILK